MSAAGLGDWRRAMFEARKKSRFFRPGRGDFHLIESEAIAACNWGAAASGSGLAAASFRVTGSSSGLAGDRFRSAAASFHLAVTGFCPAASGSSLAGTSSPLAAGSSPVADASFLVAAGSLSATDRWSALAVSCFPAAVSGSEAAGRSLEMDAAGWLRATGISKMAGTDGAAAGNSLRSA